MARRLGPIQRDIVAYLRRCGGRAYIGPTTRAPEFLGYDLEQVEAALDRLIARRIVRYERLQYEVLPDPATRDVLERTTRRFEGAMRRLA